MKFSLIICTYMRPDSLVKLLDSVNTQSKYPDEILIIDGSLNEETKIALDKNNFKNLKYFLVSEKDRGLTRQRNFGISKVATDSEIVCFLDDDTVLDPDYFEKLLQTYVLFPEAIGVGGYIVNNNAKWELDLNEPFKHHHFYFDGWRRKYSKRFLLRKKFNLLEDCSAGIIPEYGHGKSTSYFPPSNNTYKTEFFLGGVSSFKKEVLDKIKFSEYFEGYGLYEDTDFTFRVSRLGSIFLNTSAKLYHYHDEAGRPNKFEYGKMVLRNGWYVWRVAFPNPRFKSRIKWNLIAWLLIMIRVSNIVNTKKKREAITETLGRIYGWISIIINPPKEKK